MTMPIGALTLDGVRARFSLDAATDADVLEIFVQPVLPLALRPGDLGQPAGAQKHGPETSPGVRWCYAAAFATLPTGLPSP